MNRKKILVLLAIPLVLSVVFSFGREEAGRDEGYIFDKKSNISMAEIIASRKAGGTGFAAARASDRLSGETGDEPPGEPTYPEWMRGPDTLRFFKHMDRAFRKSKSLDEQFDAVKKYLYENFPEDEARVLLAVYKKYLDCEVTLAKERWARGVATDPEEVIALLARVQDTRRELMGEELADAVFGPEVKAREYAIRRAAIVNDGNLFGLEKLKEIDALNQDMWGDEPLETEPYVSPYQAYQERLKIYESDFARLETDADRQDLVKLLREQVFPPDVVEKLEAVDRRNEAEREREERYEISRREIMNNTDLSQEDADEALNALRKEIYGDEAEACRRREIIAEAAERMRKG